MAELLSKDDQREHYDHLNGFTLSVIRQSFFSWRFSKIDTIFNNDPTTNQMLVFLAIIAKRLGTSDYLRKDQVP